MEIEERVDEITAGMEYMEREILQLIEETESLGEETDYSSFHQSLCDALEYIQKARKMLGVSSLQKK